MTATQKLSSEVQAISLPKIEGQGQPDAAQFEALHQELQLMKTQIFAKESQQKNNMEVEKTQRFATSHEALEKLNSEWGKTLVGKEGFTVNPAEQAKIVDLLSIGENLLSKINLMRVPAQSGRSANLRSAVSLHSRGHKGHSVELGAGLVEFYQNYTMSPVERHEGDDYPEPADQQTNIRQLQNGIRATWGVVKGFDVACFNALIQPQPSCTIL